MNRISFYNTKCIIVTLVLLAVILLLNSQKGFTQENTDTTQKNITKQHTKTSLQTRFRKDGWNVRRIDTACSVDYLSEAEKDIVLTHNAARSNPKNLPSSMYGNLPLIMKKNTYNTMANSALNYTSEKKH